MIEFKIVKINTLDDWNMIYHVLPLSHIDKNDIVYFKHYIGTKCTKVVIEYPYYDKDYLSTYYLFYSKKNRVYPKECYRIHLFTEKNYLGYITLRPTVKDTKMGKTYLDPRFFCEEDANIMLSRYKVNLRGEVYIVPAFPWMRQETDIAVCGHVALWEILRYYGNKYINYQDITMGRIIERMPESEGRKFPISSINMQLIPNIFKQLEYSPIVIKKQSTADSSFVGELLTYIESGIPLVACMTRKRHAIAIIGHTKINTAREIDWKSNNIIYSSSLIDAVIVQDDNKFPYRRLAINKKVNPFKSDDGELYHFSDIDFIVVPLYSRMQLGYDAIITAFETYLKKNSFLDNDKKYISRIYLAASNSFKSYVYNSDTINPELQGIITALIMPKFIWCIDISTQKEYSNGFISARFILDSTCCTHELFPYILIHNLREVIYYDEKTWKHSNIDIKPYNTYVHNLEGVDVIK